ASVLPPSATITRLTRSPGSELTTPAIEASSFSVGMTTATWPGLLMLQAPAQAAARAGGGRMVGQEPGAERAIGRPVPDLAQGLLRGVAQRIVFVAALRERRDAARKRPAVRRDVHHGPRPPAHRPGRAVVVALETHAGLGHGAGGAERHAERARQRGRLVEVARFFLRHALVQRLVGACVADRVLVEEDEALQIDL